MKLVKEGKKRHGELDRQTDREEADAGGRPGAGKESRAPFAAAENGQRKEQCVIKMYV